MEETINTGVIYMITNTVNNKKYIGKAFSYVKHGKKPIRKHGAEGRFHRHIKSAERGCTEIPLLYDDIRKYGKNIFNVSVIEVCLKTELNDREKYHILNYESYKDNIGYNYFIGNNKPIDIKHVKQYENNKIESNKNRAINGNLRQSEETIRLPPNIYKRDKGYFAQIKIDSKLFNKAFLSSKESDEEKLLKAVSWLNNIKLNQN